MKLTPGRVIGWALAALDAAVIVFGLVLVLWPVKTLVVQAPDQILNPGKQVVEGGALIYKVTYCKYTNKQATVTRALIGDITYSLPSSINNVPPGCKTAISRNTLIPVGVVPGKYRLDLSATYQVNPLRSITVSHVSEEFTVVPADMPGSSTTSTSTSTTTTTTQNAAMPPAASPLPYGTDPVTGEPTQPTPTPVPTPSPTPGLFNRILRSLGLQ